MLLHAICQIQCQFDINIENRCIVTSLDLQEIIRPLAAASNFTL